MEKGRDQGGGLAALPAHCWAGAERRQSKQSSLQGLRRRVSLVSPPQAVGGSGYLDKQASTRRQTLVYLGLCNDWLSLRSFCCSSDLLPNKFLFGQHHLFDFPLTIGHAGHLGGKRMVSLRGWLEAWADVSLVSPESEPGRWVAWW